MKLDRLLSIVVLLLGRDRANAADLARRFEVTVRTIYRDLEAINEAGIPVVSFPGPGGGFGIDPSYTIDRRLLGFDDLRAIVAALKGVNSALEDKTLDSALQKMASLAPRGRAPELLEDRIVIDLFPWGRRVEERRLAKVLEPAIAERRVARFSYASYGKPREERVVEPMTLVFKSYAWYLWGFCRLRNEYRLFKLSRMGDLRVLLERFARRNEQYPREASLEAPAWTRVRLLAAPELAERAWEAFGDEDAERDSEGRLRLSINVPAGEWIVGLLLGFGPGLEVLEPESLRRALFEAALAIQGANLSRSSHNS
jgi:predicted DNA-binding transcriptional regulator YafY